MNIFNAMKIFSEETNKFLAKAIKDTFGSYVRAFFMSILIFIVGGISGAFVVANSLNPRVSAIENDRAAKRLEYLEDYKRTNDRLAILEDRDIEQKVQLQMIILYQIPSSERDKLREEAEALIRSQELEKQMEEVTIP